MNTDEDAAAAIPPPEAVAAPPEAAEEEPPAKRRCGGASAAGGGLAAAPAALPVLHLIGIFHTQHTAATSHCAFTGKALRFAKMMRVRGYRVVEYSNEGSESAADEHVVMLTAGEFGEHYARAPGAFVGDLAVTGTFAHKLFMLRLHAALHTRLAPGDLICHPFGLAAVEAIGWFPSHMHVETGIGYPDSVPGTIRIFESAAWMHYHLGRERAQGRNYDYVIPNYYDLADWDVVTSPGRYVAFLGRVVACKGLDTIRALAEAGVRVRVCGQGDASEWAHENIEVVPELAGRARSKYLGEASCVLCPTDFVEPFCGVAVEAMLCGTPVISSHFGAFRETVVHGVTGFHCHTLRDWLAGIAAAPSLDRAAIAARARAMYSLETCAAMYDAAFRDVVELYHPEGWYRRDRNTKPAEPAPSAWMLNIIC